MAIQGILKQVGTFELEDLQVKTPDINWAAITSGKIGRHGVTSGTIDDRAVGSGRIELASVITDLLADSAVTSTKLGATAVHSGHIDDRAITSGKIALGLIIGDLIAALAVASGHLGWGAITSGKSGTNAILTDNINAAAVTSGKIGARAVLGSSLEFGIQKTVQYTLVETLIDGKVVHINRSGQLAVADYHASARMPGLGILIGDTNSGVTATIITEGKFSTTNYNFSGYIGDGVYIGASGDLRAGTAWQQSGLVQQMGVIDTHSSIFVNKGSLIVV